MMTLNTTAIDDIGTMLVMLLPAIITIFLIMAVANKFKHL